MPPGRTSPDTSLHTETALRASLQVQVGGREQGGYAVDVDDWMYLVDEDTLLNRSSINKLGIRFGEITIAFRKRKG